MASSSAGQTREPSWIEIHSFTIVLDDRPDLANVAVSGDLGVFVGDLKKERKTVRLPKGPQQLERSQTWKLKRQCVAMPSDTIRVTTFKRLLSSSPFKRFRSKKTTRLRDEIDNFEFTADAVIASCCQRLDSDRDAEYMYEYKGTNSSLFLKLTLKGAKLITVPSPPSFDNIDVLGEEIDRIAASSISDDTISAFRSVFNSVADNVDVQGLCTVIESLKTFAAIHPFVNIVVTALLVPYEMLKRQHEFVGDLKALASDVCMSLKSMASAFPEMELDSAKEAVVGLLKIVVKASQYVNDFFNKGATRRFAAAQFRSKLDEHKSALHDRRLDFREAALIQILIKNGAMKDRGDDMTFLRRKLKPSEQTPIDGGCMKGTRKTVLSNLDEWLDSTDVPNLFWISGAPGAGKTAIASTVVRKLLQDGSETFKFFDCVKFFIKRGHAPLKDPRVIWRTIAYELVDLSRSEPWYRDYKIEILDVMSKKSGRAFPDIVSIEDQFDSLIREPFERLFTRASPTSRRLVIIIDALDECSTDDNDEWLAFLDTIAKWSADLPRACKLIVTSRAEEEISQKLDRVGHRLSLDTGDYVSHESREDIRHFFETKLEVKDGNSWPGAVAISSLTEYAAGLFVWATTVVNFVTQKKGDRELRLNKVMENMANLKVGDKDYIGTLYAQILLAASTDLQLEERNSVSLVLASLALLQEDLPKNALLNLLAPAGLKSRVLTSVNAAMSSLKSVIVIEGREEYHRVCHKSLLDFLLDEARVKASMAKLLHTSDQSSNLDTFSIVRQHTLLAEGCLTLMNRTLDNYDGSGILRDELVYACRHWVDHVHDADVGGSEGVNSDIPLTPLVETFIQAHVSRWVQVLSRTASARGVFLKKRRHFCNQASTVFQLVQDLLASIVENVDVEVLDIVMFVLKRLAGSHFDSSLNMATIVNMLQKPYELSKTYIAEEVAAAVGSLTAALSFSLKFMENALVDCDREYVRGYVHKLLETIIDTSKYTNDLTTCGDALDARRLEKYPLEASKFLKSMKEHLLDVREAISVHKLLVGGALERKGEIDVMPFLKCRLKPGDELPLNAGCLEGTRERILSEVAKWLKTDELPNVLWVSGAPGAGKTALATTIVHMLADSKSKFNKKLGAEFFIKQRDPKRRDPRSVWRSIAYQLVTLDRSFKVDILDVFAKDDKHNNVDGISIGSQFDLLIRNPFKNQLEFDTNAVPLSQGNIVVVIDALDECVSSDADEWRAFLATIVAWSTDLPQGFKLVVTSREEPDIVNELQDVCHRLVLDTGEIVSMESNEDIRHFLIARFQEMKVDANSAWPPSGSIEKLTDHAAGSFIWAMTVIEYISEDPQERLKVVLGSMVDSELAVGGDKLGLLYAQILLNMVESFGLSSGFDSLSLVLASMVLLRTPLPLESLREILAPYHSPSHVESIFNSFKAFIIYDGDSVLHLRHRSFSDFLLDEQRIKRSIADAHRMRDIKWSTQALERIIATFDLSRQSALLTDACLSLMNQSLKFNIYAVPSSHYGNGAIPNLDDFVKTNIPTSLEYACCYWMDHLAITEQYKDTKSHHHNKVIDNMLVPRIQTFLREHTLHWMEVLSLTKRASESSSKWSLAFVADYMEVFDMEISKLARDASKFMESFAPAISFGAPHIYISALPFAPSNSPVSVLFGPKFKNSLSVVAGRRDDWDPLLRTEHLHKIHRSKLSDVSLGLLSRASAVGDGDVDFVVCDRHGIVSTSRAVFHIDSPLNLDYRCSVYDGEVRDGVPFLAIAMNASKLVLGRRGGNIEIWHSFSGVPLEDRKPHTLQIRGVTAAIFVSDEVLALGCSDGNVITFDLLPVVRRASLSTDGVSRVAHHGIVNCMASSPDGLHFVSGSSDTFLIIWAAAKLKQIHRLQGHSGAVCAVAWSANGKYIASGSDDSTIHIWTSEGQSIRRIPSQSGAISSVAFCYNNFIVSGSRLGIIRFWSRQSGNSIGQPIIRNAAVNAVAFSEDRCCIAAVYDDFYSCIWDTRTTCGYEGALKLTDSDGHVMSIAFDTEGRRLASGSTSGELIVWDTETGRSVASWRTGFYAGIFFLQFSDLPAPNCIFAANTDGYLDVFCAESESKIQSIDIQNALERWPIAICLQRRDIFTTHLVSPSIQRGSMIVWAIWNEECIKIHEFSSGFIPITAIAISPDGTLILSAADDKTISLWCLITGRNDAGEILCDVTKFRDLSYVPDCVGVFSTLFSPTGRQFALGVTIDDGSTKFEVWDIDGPIRLFRTSAIASDCLHYEQLQKILTYDFDVYSETPESYLFVNHLRAPRFADFSPDGRVLSWYIPDGFVELQDGDIRRSLNIKCHPSLLRFSPDGKHLLTGPAGFDPSIRLWAIEDTEKNFLNPLQTTIVSQDLQKSFQIIENCPNVTSDSDIDIGASSSDSVLQNVFLDWRGNPVIDDWSYIDKFADLPVSIEGFMRSRAVGRGQSRGRVIHDIPLFWLPPENRTGFWWPRNTAVMASKTTRIDFSRFVHGDDWHLCRTSEDG
ncbi:hypothetical protein SCHPADRAFT_898656 [Schizopora paradoxa]|uniref:NACHT domain-containing protein n=1 Tax=Schizopora paradoxa TaxID=27342 RepID=A0A0H2SD80_9AGAM|nr:hypothetical protein SCHPADRAFT_898656 [Schizopora paradoxa]